MDVDSVFVSHFVTFQLFAPLLLAYLSLTILTLLISFISSSLKFASAALSAQIDPLKEHGSEFTPVTVLSAPLLASMYLIVAATLNDERAGFGDLTRW